MVYRFFKFFYSKAKIQSIYLQTNLPLNLNNRKKMKKQDSREKFIKIFNFFFKTFLLAKSKFQ